MPDRLRTSIIIVVATVWAANFTAPLFISEFSPPSEINVAFMAIIGVLSASYKSDKGKGDD